MKTRKARRPRGDGTIKQLPDGRWQARLSLGAAKGADGKAKRRRLVFYGKTQKEALDKLNEAKGKKLSGTLAHAGKLTVGQWLERWLEVKESKVEAGTHEFYTDHVRPLTTHLGGVPLAKLTAFDIEAGYAGMRAEGATDHGVQMADRTLRAALNHACKVNLIPRSPTKSVDRPKARKSDFTAWTGEQVGRFLAAVEADRLAALFTLALDSGARQGELLALDWPDVDLDAGTVSITKALTYRKGVLKLKQPKTPKSRRTVQLSSYTVAALRRHRERMEEEGWLEAPLFSDTEGGWLRNNNVTRRHFYPAAVRAGVPRIRFLDLRHTCATLLLQNGVNIKVVSERLGHTKITTTLEFYIHVMPNMQSLAADAMHGLLENGHQLGTEALAKEKTAGRQPS